MKTVKKSLPLAIVFWIFAVAVAVLIFRFSCDTGEESAEVSQSLLGLIIEFIGNFISHNTLRKIAHFSEFAALGFFVAGGIRFSFDRKQFFIPLIPCVLYSVSDEIHQYFVPERACRIFDIFVDSSGSLTGILVFILFIFIIERKMNRKPKKDKDSK